MSTLQAVWHQVEALLSAGISIIPVRDRETIFHDKVLKAKVPYSGWKQFQTEIVSKEQLWHDMEQNNTAAIAMVCGKVSGNLEAIDIDVKYQPGIDATLFAAIKDYYPDLGAKIRVQRSPSGGYHFLYRVAWSEGQSGEIPGNMQLACRAANDAEIAASPKRKRVAFIETRGEGGYIMCPPSMGYKVIRNEEIPTLTWEERCSLISLCRSFNLYIKPEVPIQVTRQASDYYDEDPWTDFSRRIDAVPLIESFGWKSLPGHSGDKIYFTRPGGAKGDTHGTFSISKRTFYVYSSNTGLDPDRAYNLGTLLAYYQFANDKKKTFAWLVSQGYGRIKPQVERRLISQKAVKSKPLPANASEEARVEYARTQEKAKAQFPFGIFWSRDEEDKIRISREGIYQCAEGLGFRVWSGNLVRIIGQFLHKCVERDLFDALKSYIADEDANEYEDICNAYEAFLQKSGAFTITRIAVLDQTLLLKDTPDVCYKYYLNGYLTIQKSGYTFGEYENVQNLIWADKIQQREYISGVAIPKNKYLEFIQKAFSYEKNEQHFKRIIGYLAHDYKDETTGYIIVLTEECPDPKQGGGSGKNIFSSLFANTTTFKNIPGAQMKFDERFLQAWDGQRILAISDVPKHFDFLFLKELSTGSGIMKKLFKDEVTIEVADMPKFIIQTNYSYEISDGGLRRRVIPIEFTNFFTISGGVDVHFGCHFPNGWTTEDWMGYDHFIAECVQSWLQGGRKLVPLSLSTGGWRKQFEQEFGTMTYQFIEENWADWCRRIAVKISDFNTEYMNFCIENNVNKKFHKSSFTMNQALNVYAKHHNIVFIASDVIRDGLSTIKVKQFMQPPPF